MFTSKISHFPFRMFIFQFKLQKVFWNIRKVKKKKDSKIDTK